MYIDLFFSSSKLLEHIFTLFSRQQIGEVTETVDLLELPLTLKAEERGNGKYLIVFHMPMKDRHVG